MLRRRILDGLAVISGLCLVGTVIVWPVSRRYWLHVDYLEPGRTAYHLHAESGRIQWSYARTENSATPVGLSVGTTAISFPSPWTYQLWERRSSARYNRISILGIWWVHDPDVSPYYLVDFAVPCSELAILFAILPGVALIARRRKDRGPGLCRHCSYDLRAHGPGDACPECGTVIQQREGNHEPV